MRVSNTVHVLLCLVLSMALVRCYESEKINYRIYKHSIDRNDVPSRPFDLSYQWRNEIHLYNFDFKTTNELCSYSIKGKLDFKLDLAAIFDHLDPAVYSATVINPDTIIILSQSNNIYICDQSGQIKRNINLSKLGLEGLNLAMPCFVEANELLTALLCKPAPSSPTDPILLNAWLNRQPLVAKINLNSGKVKLQLSELVPRFLQNDEIDPEGVLYFPFGSGYIYASAFTDTFYHIGSNGKLLQKVKLQSSLQRRLHVKPIKLEDQQKGLVDISTEYKKSTFLSGLEYLPNLDCFVGLIREPEVMKKGFPVRLLILNRSFETIEEIAFDAGEYFPKMLPAKNGVYLRKANPNFRIHAYDRIEFYK